MVPRSSIQLVPAAVRKQTGYRVVERVALAREPHELEAATAGRRVGPKQRAVLDRLAAAGGPVEMNQIDRCVFRGCKTSTAYLEYLLRYLHRTYLTRQTRQQGRGPLKCQAISNVPNMLGLQPSIRFHFHRTKPLIRLNRLWYHSENFICHSNDVSRRQA